MEKQIPGGLVLGEWQCRDTLELVSGFSMSLFSAALRSPRTQVF